MYNDDLSSLSQQWDDTNGQSFPVGDNIMLLDNPGDPALNSVDNALGFGSIRYEYDYQQQFDRNWNSPAPNVNQYEFQNTMNLQEEVIIGNYVYKQVGDGIIVKISAYDATALDLVRKFGINASVDMEVYNENYGTSSNHLATRGVCDFTLRGKQLENSTIAKITWDMFDLNGANTVACGAFIKISFGDGTSDEIITKGSINHQYDVPSGTSKSFTIKSKIESSPGCTSCIGKTEEFIITISNLPPCFEGKNDERPIRWIDFRVTQAGVDRAASIGSVFKFRGVGGWFTNPKVWLNAKLEVQKSNGSWTSATSNTPITMEMFGKLKSNNCVANTPISESNSFTSCSSGELEKGDLPSKIGISVDLNETLNGRIKFGPIVYSKDYWNW
jgi:hypothetical protein